MSNTKIGFQKFNSISDEIMNFGECNSCYI